jgi:hypothetical protein
MAIWHNMVPPLDGKKSLWFNSVLIQEHPHQNSVGDPAKTFLTSKFSYLLFCTLSPMKLKPGLQIGGNYVIAKPSGPVIMIDQSKTRISSQIVFITLFSSRCTVSLPQHLDQICRRTTIFLSQTGIYWFSSCKFNVQGHHILSTDGDGLKSKLC